jgi:hypothetical protein
MTNTVREGGTARGAEIATIAAKLKSEPDA